MNHYKESWAEDIVSVFHKSFADGRLYFDRDYSLQMRAMAPHETPWIHVRSAGDKRCPLYQDIMFTCTGLVHSVCQECWKVVVRPRTLEQLFALLEIQEHKTKLPCKCGTERRPSVCGLYGGYFYNDSLEEGREAYREVRGLVDEYLGKDVAVILKRACTEYEHAPHTKPSDQWKIVSGQERIEHLLTFINYPNTDPPKGELAPQPDVIKNHVIRSWVEWAYSVGDMTYLNYTGGELLYEAYKTYHEEA